MTETTASVVIACHTDERFDQLLAAIRSAQEQEPAPHEVIIAVDHNPALGDRLRSEVDAIEVVDHQGDRGASGTRNAGAALARSPYLVFLDGDVGAHPGGPDVFLRVGPKRPGPHRAYVPSAVVDHAVPLQRSTFRFFLRRCYWEGAGKIELSAHLGDDRDLGDERSHLTRTLPSAFVRDLVSGQFRRAMAIVAGVTLAAAGGAVSLARAAATRLER